MTVLTQQPTERGVLLYRTSRQRPDQGYYLYVPRGFDGSAAFRLLVTVHGHDREAVGRVEHFVDLAEHHNFVLLGPQFDPSIRFQMLGIGGERADLRLLDLVAEVSADLSLAHEQFDLFGYSGGGQFAHRFLYAWPRRVRHVIVGAPGTVTMPDAQHRWPGGIRNLASVAGERFDLDEVRRRRIMLLVGTDDILLEGLNQQPWAMRSGATRLARARTLHAAWLVAGIDHTYVEVPGVGHGVDGRIVEQVRRFLTTGPRAVR
jgi:pimeloyl-ACP methyl ester carboxylesterase